MLLLISNLLHKMDKIDILQAFASRILVLSCEFNRFDEKQLQIYYPIIYMTSSKNDKKKPSYYLLSLIIC